MFGLFKKSAKSEASPASDSLPAIKVPKYNFHYLALPPNGNETANQPIKQAINVPGARCFTIDNFLTADECNYFIKQTEALGYETLKKEYPAEYRDNERYVNYKRNVTINAFIEFWLKALMLQSSFGIVYFK